MEKFIKIEDPCAESWEQMHEISGGRFCDLCSKKVLDLTNVSDAEILKLFNNDSICVKISNEQLQRPLIPINLEAVTQNNIQFSKIVAGLLLATTIVGASYAQEKEPNLKESIKIEQSSNFSKNNQKKEEQLSSTDILVFKGELIDQYTKIPISNVKISFFSLSQLFVGFTDENGEFSIEIPTSLVKNENVVTYEYNGIEKEKYSRGYGFPFENITRIKSKAEINYFNKEIIYNKSVSPEESLSVTLGGAILCSVESYPTYCLDGKKISEGKFKRLLKGNPNLKYYYFTGDEARIIYGKVVEFGLYLIYSNQ